MSILRYVIVLVCMGMTAGPVFSQDGAHEVILISTNDVHGRINNFSKMAAYVKALKKDNPDVFVLNAGDLVNGNPVVDEAQDKGYPIMDIMNRIPYDVSCPGNHEFEFGEEVLSRRIKQSGSVYLGANMKVDSLSPIRPLKPYCLLHTSDGGTLAVLGLTTGSSNPCLIHHVTISDPVKKAQEFRWLRKDNAIFIVLSHIGYVKDSVLATTMQELDVVIGGHSHTEIPHGKMVNGVLITQTGDKLRYIGKTVLTIKDHKVIGKTFEMIDLSKLTDTDPAVQASIDEYNKNNVFGEPIGEAASDFTNKEELGSWKADAIAEILHLDIAFDHTRNISFSKFPRGKITRGDIYQMDAFDYQLFRYDLTPAEIRTLIGKSLPSSRDGSPVLFVSGMSYTVTRDAAGGSLPGAESSGAASPGTAPPGAGVAAGSSSGGRLIVLKDRTGSPLDEHKKYSVGMNSYIACHFMQGVDGGTPLEATTAGSLLQYMSLHKTVDYSRVRRAVVETVKGSSGADGAEDADEQPRPSGKSAKTASSAPRPNAAAQPHLIRGPYLQAATTHSMVVRWRTDALTRGRVGYGSSPDRLDLFADDSTLATEHIVRIEGLQSESRYYYSVGSLNSRWQGDSSNYFCTLPEAGKSGDYRIGVFGDCGNNSVNQRNTRQAVLNFLGTRYMNAWILLGDNAYSDGTDAEFQAKFFNIYKDDLLKKYPLFPAPGNHDYHDIEFSAAVAQKTHAIAYYQDFSMPENGESGGVPSHTRAFYSFDIGNAHFLSLDSYGKEDSIYSLYDTTGPQVQWIKKDLEANKNKQWVIAYWHHPPYTMGSHSSDREKELVKIRENFIRILERYGVDLILCGHSHDYERSSLMKGHYGPEASFSAGAYNLSNSSGRYDGSPNSCPYNKQSATGAGTIYVVSGSAGQLGGMQPGYPHNAMVYANAEIGGATMLEVRDNRLDLQWVCSDGVVRDRFSLMKDAGKTVKIRLRKGESAVLKASFVSDHYSWTKASGTGRQISVTPSVGKTVYEVRDGLGCLEDHFEVTVTR